jgi:hypothetical protein
MLSRKIRYLNKIMNALYLPVMFFLCHFVPDFWLQTDWMALNKGKKTWNCLVHVLIYTSCFLFITLSWKALLFIGATHFILDRWHIILKRMIWWKNHFPTGKYPPFKYCDTTGYYDTSPINSANDVDWLVVKYGQPRPFYITIWLYIFQDNILHLVCNFIALMYLAS